MSTDVLVTWPLSSPDSRHSLANLAPSISTGPDCAAREPNEAKVAKTVLRSSLVTGANARLGTYSKITLKSAVDQALPGKFLTKPQILCL